MNKVLKQISSEKNLIKEDNQKSKDAIKNLEEYNKKQDYYFK